MFRSAFTGATAALFLVASPASAEPFSDFVDFCVTTNAERQTVANAVKSAGWVAMPPGILGDDPPFEDAEIYLSELPDLFSDKGPPADLGMLLTGSAEGEEVFEIGGVRVDVCVVAMETGSAERLRGRLEALLGFNAIEKDGETVWVFSRQGDGFASENALVDMDEALLPQLAGQKKIYFAGVIEDNDITGLVMAAVRPD